MTNSMSAPQSSIGRNTLINVVGSIAPIVVSLVTVPVYLRTIGEARYGVLAIVWLLVGYFGVFEFGLSRATANQLARTGSGEADAEERETIFWTAISANLAFGLIGGAILVAVAHFAIGSLPIPAGFRSEVRSAIPLLGAAVPLGTVAAVLTGALEGSQRFLSVNFTDFTRTILLQVGPLAVAIWRGPDLTGLIVASVGASLAATAIAFAVCKRMVPLRGRPRFDRARVPMLVRYGGWVTVTGLVGPLLAVMDRFVIAAINGVQAVTHYVVPFNLVTRAQIVPAGLARSLFPRLSMLGASEARAVGREALVALVVVMTPLVVFAMVVMKPFLAVWIGPEFAEHAAPVGVILLFGIWLNALAFVPFALLQAQGRPDIPAKFHVAELIPYAATLWLGLSIAGVDGAAWAWTLRAGADAALLFFASRISLGRESEFPVGFLTVVFACGASLTAFHGSLSRAVLGGAMIVASAGWAWRRAPTRLRGILLRRPPRIVRPVSLPPAE